MFVSLILAQCICWSECVELLFYPIYPILPIKFFLSRNNLLVMFRYIISRSTFLTSLKKPTCEKVYVYLFVLYMSMLICTSVRSIYRMCEQEKRPNKAVQTQNVLETNTK